MTSGHSIGTIIWLILALYCTLFQNMQPLPSQVQKFSQAPRIPSEKLGLSVEPAVSTAAIYSMPSLFCRCACLTVIYTQHPHLVIFCFTFMSLTLLKNLTPVSVYFLSLLALSHSIASLCFSSSCSSYSFTLISWHGFLLH